MADQKFLSAFGIERRYHFTESQREELRTFIELPLDDEDYLTLERSLDRTHALYIYLQAAPPISSIIAYCERVERAIHDLRLLLRPHAEPWASMDQPPRKVGKDDVRLFGGPELSDEEAKAAPVVTDMLREMSQTDPERLFQEIWLNLSEIRDFLVSAQEISERRTYHLIELIEGAQSIAEKHERQKTYTRHPITNKTTSFAGHLAYHVAASLPQNMRPKSESALTNMIVELTAKANRGK